MSSYNVRKLSCPQGEINRMAERAKRSRFDVDFLKDQGLQRDSVVLDLGCGPGVLTKSLATHLTEGHVTALDSCPQMLEEAKGGLEGLRNADLIQQDALKLDLPADTFDFVVARMLFFHVADHGTLLKNILRVLKPGI